MGSALKATCAGLLALTLGAGAAAADMFKAYVGKYPSEPINGVSFNEHPVVKREIIEAGGEWFYKTFQELTMEAPMPSEHGAILAFKGRPHGFDTTMALVFSLEGKLLALCYHDATDPKPSNQGEAWAAIPFKTNSKERTGPKAQACPSDFAEFTRRAEASGIEPPARPQSATLPEEPPPPPTNLPPPPDLPALSELPTPPGPPKSTPHAAAQPPSNLPPPPPPPSMVARPVWVGGPGYCERHGSVIGAKQVNLRSGPSTSFPVITALAQNTSLVLCNYENSWYGVVIGNPASCGLNLATTQPYNGPCLHGWMYQGFVALQ